jgi:hypothetical protein
MPLSPAAETELRTLLRRFKAAHGATAIPTGAGKALEAWLLFKLADAASQMRYWRVTLRQGDGTSLPVGSSFKLPNQHSGIPASNVLAPGYVRLEHRAYLNLRFEIHGSLQWMGRSGARHECDISMLPVSIGNAIRNNGGGYPHGLPITAIECKDKTSSGTLDETRQTLARLFDLALITRPPTGRSCRIFEANTNSDWGRSSSTYVSLFARGTFGIARAGGFQGGTGSLSRHFHIARFPAVYDATRRSVAYLLQHFRNTLNAVQDF